MLTPLDAEIVMVKPKWLCETFGFHPMLGFRREKQARSIAHGCAATLMEFANLDPVYLNGWDIDEDLIPKAKSFSEAESVWWKKRYRMPGECWLRPEKPCPFSKVHLLKLNRELSESDDGQTLDSDSIDELSMIHKFCKQSKTHRAE